MKNKLYFIGLFLFLLLSGCSKNNNPIETPDISPSPSPAYDLFGISKNINLIKEGKYSFQQMKLAGFMGVDASKSNNAWAGFYELESKKKFIEFADNETWPQEVLDDGLKSLYPIFYNEEGCVLYLSSNGFDINYNSFYNTFPMGFGRFYFVKNNKVINKIEGNSQTNGSPTIIINFRNYLDGFILANKKEIDNSLSFDYFDHTLTHKFSSNILALNPTSFEEEIMFDNKTFTAKKINLKTNKVLFEKEINVVGLVYGAVENTVKEINGNEWIITNKWKENVDEGWAVVEYRYFNKYSLNIMNGDVKVITKKQEL